MLTWDEIMAEFDRMNAVDQLRAVSKVQMEWLVEAAQGVPNKDALDLGFGCGMSAVAMTKGGCSVTSINNEDRLKPRRLEADQRFERICGQPPNIIETGTDRALPKLLEEGRKFGLIFIDAGHRFDDVFVELHYAKDLCVPGGILALDDTYYGAIRTVANWIVSNMSHIWEPHDVLYNTISWKRTDIKSDDAAMRLAHRTHAGPPKTFDVGIANADEYLFYLGPEKSKELGFKMWQSRLFPG
jgi:predicted O-methyltransferase YrrM